MRTEKRLEGILNFVDDHDAHRVYRHTISGEVVGYYDVDEHGVGYLMCTDMTANSYAHLLEDYEGDAEVFFKAFAEDAANQGLPRELDFRVVEVWPDNRSDKDFPEGEFDGVRVYDERMCWDDEDDGLAVVLNTVTGDMAVYERQGCVCCLFERWGIYTNVDMDDKDEFRDSNEKIRNLLVQEAIDAGFSERCPV